MRKWMASGWFAAAVAACSVALLTTMVLGTLAELAGLAGGLPPFDLRAGGYTLDEARDFLAALGRDGVFFYANVQLRVDVIYPATYAVSRGLLLWWLTQPGRPWSWATPFVLRVVLGLGLPMAAAAFDYAENHYIALMLRDPSAIGADLVAAASFSTQAKSVLTVVVEVGWSALAIATLMCTRRRRHG